jgi:hypothetical protein
MEGDGEAVAWLRCVALRCVLTWALHLRMIVVGKEGLFGLVG